METLADVTMLTWLDVERLAASLADRWTESGIRYVWGVPRGGVPVAMMVARALGCALIEHPEGYDRSDVLIVDDLVDSGRTLTRWREAGYVVDALVSKRHSPLFRAPLPTVDGWVVFPWEGTEVGPYDAVTRLIEYVGEDPNRPGLADTPRRVVSALAEMTAGYRVDVGELLAVQFTEPCDEIVLVRGITFTSMCEHHLLPFTGTATVGYLPAEVDGLHRVVGLSKLPRLVLAFAQRLQVQERMTREIAEAIATHLAPEGVGVVVEARHSCMGVRGVKQPAASMVTSSMLGSFRSDPAQRNEFLALARHS